MTIYISKDLPCWEDLAECEEEDAATEEKEAHVDDVVDVDGKADLASFSLFGFVLLVACLGRGNLIGNHFITKLFFQKYRLALCYITYKTFQF